MEENTSLLVIPRGLWSKAKDLLFQSSSVEGFALALARPLPCRKGYRHVVEQLISSETLASDDSDAYERRGTSGLALSPFASGKANRISVDAARLGLAPVHLHSHPPGISDFSACDDQHENELHEWLRNQGQPFLWSLVCPYGGIPKVRIWHAGNCHTVPVRLGLQTIGNDDKNSNEELPTLQRQLAFGPGLRYAADSLLIGIVGLGGLGMIVAESLSRAGFRHFVLVDHDRVDHSNLNRLPSTSARDVGREKVRVARRIIRASSKAIGTVSEVSVFPYDVYTAPSRVIRRLQECDLILALTDDHISRTQILKSALDGGSVYLQAGVDILIEQGENVRLAAEVTGAEVGRYCPFCTGRLDATMASIEARRYAGDEIWEHAKHHGYVPDVAAPSVMSLNHIAAGLLVLEIQRRVSGLGEWDLIQVELNNGGIRAHESVEQQLSGQCNVCGRKSNHRS